MPVDLTIGNVPDDVAERLQAQASRNRRSLRDEFLVILEEAAHSPGYLTAGEILAEARRLGVGSPAEAVGMIRADRDSR